MATVAAFAHTVPVVGALIFMRSNLTKTWLSVAAFAPLRAATGIITEHNRTKTIAKLSLFLVISLYMFFSYSLVVIALPLILKNSFSKCLSKCKPKSS